MSSRSSRPAANKLGDFPVAEKASREVISLPMHPFLSEADQDLDREAVKCGIEMTVRRPARWNLEACAAQENAQT